MKSTKVSSSVEGVAVYDIITANLVALRRLSESPSLLVAHTPGLRTTVLRHLDTISLTLNKASAGHGLPAKVQIENVEKPFADGTFAQNGTFENFVRLRNSDAQLVHRERAACLGALYVTHGLRLCLACDAVELEQGRDFALTQNCLLDLPTKPIDLAMAGGLNATLREIGGADTAETVGMIKGSQWVIYQFWSSLTGSGSSRAYHVPSERHATSS